MTLLMYDSKCAECAVETIGCKLNVQGEVVIGNATTVRIKRVDGKLAWVCEECKFGVREVST